MNDPLVYLNGVYAAQSKASLSPLDRGFLLGDGVYEVIPVYFKKTFLLDPHIDRLNQSLESILMKPFFSHAKWHEILAPLIENNESEHQWVYLQISRGVDNIRGHKIPNNIKPTVFAISYPNHVPDKETIAKGLKTISVQDIRWQKCHIKTTSRLAYVLMYQEAVEKGCDEAIIINNGFAVEATISNIFIVKNNTIITPPKSNHLLSGITRDFILDLAKKNNITYKEANITEKEIIDADEFWISSSTRGLHPVVEFNNKKINNGNKGPLWSKLWDVFWQSVDKNK